MDDSQAHGRTDTKHAHAFSRGVMGGIAEALAELNAVSPNATLPLAIFFMKVAEGDGNRHMSSIAKEMGVTQAAVSRYCGTLGERGPKNRRGEGVRLIASDEDPNDSRYRVLSLTKKGREVAARISTHLSHQ